MRHFRKSEEKACLGVVVAWRTLIGTLGLVSAAQAAVVPFTESFNTDSANWFNAAGTAVLPWVPGSGINGGGFAQTTFNFLAAQPNADLTMIRASQALGSSNGAFFGNWIADGVGGFSFFIRHDAPVPVGFFARMAGTMNFPGAVAVSFTPVPPDQWTLIEIPITPLNPQFVTFENSNFAAVFGDIGHIQIGLRVPESLAGMDEDIVIGVDSIRIVPEPATILLLALAGATVAPSILRRRRKPS